MAKVRASFIVYNMPDVQELKDFVVARVIENAKGIPEFWYWGTWHSSKKAVAVSEEIGGIVFESCEIISSGNI